MKCAFLCVAITIGVSSFAWAALPEGYTELKYIETSTDGPRVADGEPGLYDLRGKKFYGNDSGVGAFTAGPDVILPSQGLVLSIY